MSHADRDLHFQPSWHSVVVAISGSREVEVSISKSFWRDCSELRSAEIGRWMLQAGLAPWPAYSPPEFVLEPAGVRRFVLSRS